MSVARRKKRQGQALVVLAGCFPQIALDKAATAGVDLLVGSNDKSRIVELVTLHMSGRKGPLIQVSEWSKDTHFEIISETSSIGRTRATLKVQDGCEQFCAYCIIPYARGPERSLPPSSVYEQAQHLADQGFKEIVVSGIHLGAYGRDLEPRFSLTQLLQQLSTIKGLARLRLGSVEPNDVDDGLIAELLSNPILCRHLHIPLQSGSDSVLRRMSRRYTTDEYRRLVEKIRTSIPDIGITSDLIVGFPGEDDAEFLQTVDFLSSALFSRLHVFRYSKRSGTPAASMEQQVPEAIKEERVKKVHKLAEESALRFHRSLLSHTVEVLVENDQGDYYVGHTSSYVKVFIQSAANIAGRLVNVQIDSATSEGVYGQLGRILDMDGELIQGDV